MSCQQCQPPSSTQVKCSNTTDERKALLSPELPLFVVPDDKDVVTDDETEPPANDQAINDARVFRVVALVMLEYFS